MAQFNFPVGSGNKPQKKPAKPMAAEPEAMQGNLLFPEYAVEPSGHEVG